ncbi:hypothetical protein OPQ96_005505 [Pseudomonas aeruginosa]|nr:hypothetical protein [Pseudomonas aeruginosa]
MKLDSRHSLSLKLLRVVLLAALAVGVVLSCAQIVFDAYKAKQAVSSDAQLRESEINQKGKARKLWDIEEGKGI